MVPIKQVHTKLTFTEPKQIGEYASIVSDKSLAATAIVGVMMVDIMVSVT